jgi:nucleoside-diphosphate-sugar epimerase
VRHLLLMAPHMLSHLPVRLIAKAWLETNMARYLITGIAGFIGSSLAHELVRLGHDVRGVDNLSSGNLRNLDPILDDIDFRQMDINDTERLRDFCVNVDYVLHQAAIASVPRSVQDPIGSHIANIDGTLSVLIAALFCLRSPSDAAQA